MANGNIPDSSITASSYQGGFNNRSPKHARLGLENKLWISREDDPTPWIQVDLASNHTITGLQTEGNNDDGHYDYWVTQVKVKVGMSGGYRKFIADSNGQPKVR